jgi:hypothetical protein
MQARCAGDGRDHHAGESSCIVATSRSSKALGGDDKISMTPEYGDRNAAERQEWNDSETPATGEIDVGVALGVSIMISLPDVSRLRKVKSGILVKAHSFDSFEADWPVPSASPVSLEWTIHSSGTTC